MTDEQELLHYFHKMDAEAKEFTLNTARSQARLWPLVRLSLVASSPGYGPFPRILGSLNDVDPPPIGRPPVKIEQI